MPITSNKDRKIDTIEVGLLRLAGSAKALKGERRNGLSTSQAHVRYGVFLSEFLDSFDLTNNIC
jgi:hypothetical protein